MGRVTRAGLSRPGAVRPSPIFAPYGCVGSGTRTAARARPPTHGGPMPMQPAPAALGDEQALFAELHPKLARQVRRLVRTGEENVQDACSFAFVQLFATSPPASACSRGCSRLQSAKRSSSIDATDATGGSCPRGRRRGRARRRARRPRAAARDARGARRDRGRRPDRPAGSDRRTPCRRTPVQVDQRDARAERTDRGAAAVARPAEAPFRARRARRVKARSSQALTW